MAIKWKGPGACGEIHLAAGFASIMRLLVHGHGGNVFRCSWND